MNNPLPKILLLVLCGLLPVYSTAAAAEWQKNYPEISLGVITSENEADRVERYKPIRTYLEKTLGVSIKWRSATDYAGVIEAMKAKKVELARFGPASYAKAWIVMKGEVEPLVAELNKDGDFGYHAVVIVRQDSPYETMTDLKGKKLAFADPNSTSGYQAPRYFLTEAGYDPDKFFGSTAFSGSHENSIMALLNGTFDAAATWYNNESRSNMTRMEEKKMIPPGRWKIVWKSPLLPSSPWAVPIALPADMREDFRKALYNMPKDGPDAWQALTDGKAGGLKLVNHKDYEAIVRMIQENLKHRKSG